MRKVGSIGEVTARAVRRAAADLIAEHGYEAMSMRQLAARVGLTSGALYNHFGSKQALLSGLLESVMTDLLAAVQRDVLCLSDPVEQLRVFIELHIGFHVSRKNDVLIATTELRSLDATNLAKVVRLRNRYEVILSSILRRGVRLRIFSLSDVKTTTLAIIPMLTGVAQWYRPGRRMTREQLIERYIALCMAMVGATEMHARDRSQRKPADVNQESTQPDAVLQLE